MSRRTKILIVVLLPALLVGGLYLRSLVKRIFFERRETGESSVRARLDQAAIQSTGGATQTVTLYFPSFSQGKLEAEPRTLAMAPAPADRVRQIVLALIEGPRQGQGRSLSESADVRAVFLTHDGTAYVDLSGGALAGFNPGIKSETLAVYSIVDSLASNLPEVKRVQFLVQGQQVDTLDGHADLTAPFAPNPSWIASTETQAPGTGSPAAQ